MSDSLFPYPGTDADEGEVRLVLTEGRSRLPGWRFFAAEAEQRVLVGTSPDCDWQVAADGVAPHHLELVWAGDILWVAPATQGKGNVWLAGALVDEWTRVEADAELGFGQARVFITGVTDLFAPTVISSVDQVAKGRADVAKDAAAAPASARASGFESVEPVTIPVAMPPSMPVGVPAPAPDKTAMTDLEDLRRWRDSCVEENQAGGAVASAPAPVASPPPVPMASPRPEPVLAAPPAPALVPRSQPVMAHVKQAPAPAPLLDEPRVVEARPAAAHKPSAGKRLAAPPPMAPQPAGGTVEPKRTFVDFARDVVERVTDTVPTRVAIAAMAVIFVVALLLLHDRVGAKDDPPRSKPAPTTNEPSVTKITPEPNPKVEPAESLDPDERVLEEGRAARLVAAGRLSEALPVYERLLANEPGNEAFAITIRVIRHQLAAKCKAAGGTGGEACAEAR